MSLASGSSVIVYRMGHLRLTNDAHDSPVAMNGNARNFFPLNGKRLRHRNVTDNRRSMPIRSRLSTHVRSSRA